MKVWGLLFWSINNIIVLDIQEFGNKKIIFCK